MERRYDWHDPTPLAERALSTDGLTFLQAMIAEGQRPPMAATLDFDLVEVGEGWTRWQGRPGAWAMNPIGGVHGGYAATVLDSALACAVHSTLAQGEVYTTLEIKISMVRAIKPDAGGITAKSSVVYRGRRTATAEGQLFNQDGKLAAHGTTTCLIFQP